MDREENFKISLKKIKYTPGEELANTVWRNILVRNRKITYLKLTSFSFIGITSLVGIIPMFKILISDLTQSGFYEYLSLAFSGGFISSYWKDFTFSLAESLPTISIIFSLTLVFVFFLSLHFLIKQIIRNKLLISLRVNPA